MTEDEDSRDSLTESSGEGGSPSGPGMNLKHLLKGALANDAATPSVDVLAGVQQKLRERSGGKFYKDLWSTAKEPPTLTFFATSLFMLVIVLLAYAVLAPLRGHAEKVHAEPAPVEVVAPAPHH
jgi:hypothetical protein